MVAKLQEQIDDTMSRFGSDVDRLTEDQRFTTRLLLERESGTLDRDQSTTGVVSLIVRQYRLTRCAAR